MYDPSVLSAHFDQYGSREWDRLVATPRDEVSLYLHTHYLRKHVRPGMRVLEIGAGAGRFTMALAKIGARVLVADLSPGQLALNRENAARFGFAAAVEDWRVLDICDLSSLPEMSFEVVVVYGGPFSYVLERRDAALTECLRVLRPGGALLGSVMLLWGSAHAFLPGVLALPPEENQRVTASGDLTPATITGRPPGASMHAFRSTELCDWLTARGLEILDLSAAGVLSSTWDIALKEIRQDGSRWNELLRMELEASAAPGCLDMSTHLIFAAGKK